MLIRLTVAQKHREALKLHGIKNTIQDEAVKTSH